MPDTAVPSPEPVTVTVRPFAPDLLASFREVVNEFNSCYRRWQNSKGTPDEQPLAVETHRLLSDAFMLSVADLSMAKLDGRRFDPSSTDERTWHVKLATVSWIAEQWLKLSSALADEQQQRDIGKLRAQEVSINAFMLRHGMRPTKRTFVVRHQNGFISEIVRTEARGLRHPPGTCEKKTLVLRDDQGNISSTIEARAPVEMAAAGGAK